MIFLGYDRISTRSRSVDLLTNWLLVEMRWFQVLPPSADKSSRALHFSATRPQRRPARGAPSVARTTPALARETRVLRVASLTSALAERHPRAAGPQRIRGVSDCGVHDSARCRLYEVRVLCRVSMPSTRDELIAEFTRLYRHVEHRDVPEHSVEHLSDAALNHGIKVMREKAEKVEREHSQWRDDFQRQHNDVYICGKCRRRVVLPRLSLFAICWNVLFGRARLPVCCLSPMTLRR